MSWKEAPRRLVRVKIGQTAVANRRPLSRNASAASQISVYLPQRLAKVELE